MTDFEHQNLHAAASLDNLSLKNWTLPSAQTPQDSSEPDSNKSRGGSDETSSGEGGIISIIPGFIRDVCKDPKSAELRVAYDAPTLQCTYTYAISWEDDGDSDCDSKFSKICEASQLARKITSSISFGGPPTPVTARCDGPCKKEFPSNLLSTIGRCDHYLCNACYGIVKNSDGTNGCSSLNCFWKGTSREESKKNYEKDVCRKQRTKATEMNSLGIDVKPASAASSRLTLTSSVSAPTSSNSATSDAEGTLSIVPSVKSRPNPKASIRLRLIIVEPSEQYGMTHTYCILKALSCTKLITAIETMLVRKQRSTEEYIPKASLYYGLLKEDGTMGMRRIKTASYSELTIGDIPKLGHRLVLIMDMGDYVPKGTKIYLE
ncbi:hypothetical protein B9Z55_012728 [Caenorhabditis nigoni]|uniref:RING-type domain-containing protein n=1 Tax=Caenorhabditis nigoni TaxID=1611254 RepID=A0A2G5TYK3_9PELO|nr:hypothetical protein B9Z55_012728 [Caenorhabditis nigoni]